MAILLGATAYNRSGLLYCVDFIGLIGAWAVRSRLSETGDLISNSERNKSVIDDEALFVVKAGLAL